MKTAHDLVAEAKQHIQEIPLAQAEEAMEDAARAEGAARARAVKAKVPGTTEEVEEVEESVAEVSPVAKRGGDGGFDHAND